MTAAENMLYLTLGISNSFLIQSQGVFLRRSRFFSAAAAHKDVAKQ